jgi:transcriptional regulator with XRE-family HTH domain
MISLEIKLYGKMLSMENFGAWLLKELENRNWSQSDLVKAAGISRGTLSNIISGARGIGEKSLISIANALNISPITIFRKAGLLPESGETGAFDDWKHLLAQLSPEEQEEMRQIAIMKIERNRKAEQSSHSTNSKSKK